MSVLDSVLKEEYDRISRIIYSVQKELEELPKGYISEKKIKGHIYYYLQYRENRKMKTIYIKKNEVDAYRNLISHRKELEKDLKELNQSLKKLERVLK